MDGAAGRQRPRRRTIGAATAAATALVLVAGGATAAYGTGGSGTDPAEGTPTGTVQATTATATSAQDALGWRKEGHGSATGLGARAGVLPAKKQVLESALRVDLTHTPEDNPFGPAVLDFTGAPDFSPERVATPGPQGFPLAAFAPGAVAEDGYSPFIRIDGSPAVYDAPIVAVGDGPFDVDTHTNTGDRVLGVHLAQKSPPGQFLESWADLLFVKGFDAGQPIVYLSTDAGQPLTAVLERSTYVPALDRAAFNGGDDFLGSARERLFAFVNGQTGRHNKQAQGFRHFVLDGHASEDASARNTELIRALRNGGDLLNVFGDFPTLRDPRHSQAYSPLWDAQLGEWTPKAVRQGYDKRQVDENVVFNLAATRPDLLTGPGGAPYGSVGIDIDCAVIAYLKEPPTANLEPPAPRSQFPPR